VHFVSFSLIFHFSPLFHYLRRRIHSHLIVPQGRSHTLPHNSLKKKEKRKKRERKSEIKKRNETVDNKHVKKQNKRNLINQVKMMKNENNNRSEKK
jgi:hypothetical protein